MEVTTDFVHNNYKMVRPPRREEVSVGDFADRDLLLTADLASPAMSAFISNRYSEYKKLSFPLWKRFKLTGMTLPDISVRHRTKYTDPNAKPMISLSSDEVELLDRLDFEGSDRKLLLLGDICFSEGTMISVPPRKRVSKPYVIPFSRDSRIMNNLFVSGKGSSIKLVIDSTSSGSWLLQNNRFLIKEDSTVEVLYINRMTERGYGFSNNLYFLEKNAKLRVVEASTGNASMAVFHMVLLEGEGAQASVEPLFVARGDTVLDMHYVVKAISRNSEGMISGSGVLLDNGRSVFRGTLDMRKGAKGSKASEHSSVLMLSQKARADTIPSLLVGESEVEASHAATVGSVDEQRVFYLMSRGFSRERAIRFIVQGTFEPVLKEIDKIFPTFTGVVRNEFAKEV